ncbi:MAG: hypothetical protein WCF36_07565 [Candidatus Nanopelagicales bacterium]
MTPLDPLEASVVLRLAEGPLTEGYTVAGVDRDRPAAPTVTSRAERTTR